MRPINLSLVSCKRRFSSPASLVNFPLLCWKIPPLYQTIAFHRTKKNSPFELYMQKPGFNIYLNERKNTIFLIFE